jgi:hypothetical protein
MSNPPPPASRLLPRSAADCIVVAVAVLVCGYFALSFLYAALANFWPGPFVDYWIDIPNVEKFFNGTLSLHDLVSAHANVHRLFIPRLLFIADFRYASGTNALLVAISFLCKSVTLLLFLHIFRDQPLHTRVLAGTLCAAAILNAANLSNVLHNSNMQWDLVSVFSCLAIYFYCQNLDATPRQRLPSLAFAWVFFACGFLSQAGALPVLCVFVFISLLNRKWLEALASVLLMAAVFYLTFFVLPVNEPDKPTYENALVIFILKLKYVALYVFRMFSGSIYPLDHEYFVFSWIMLALLAFSLVLSHQTRAVYHNVFLHLALFAVLMMVIIAAARLDFAPNTWAANRYQTNVMLFILSISLHSYFALPTWFGNHDKPVLRQIVLAFSLGSFFITQYFLASYPFVFGNKVSSAQAYMLTHGANQQNGADLLPSLQAFDRIAESDPFFRAYGFAWYHNKQGGNAFYRSMKNVGDPFLDTPDIAGFAHSCADNRATIRYSAVPGAEGLQFSTALDTAQHAVVFSSLIRNTDYVLNADGVVIGFSWLFIDPEHPLARADLRGYVTQPGARYLVEVDSSGQPHCRYQLIESTIETP